MTHGRECGKRIPGGTAADRHRVSAQQWERLYGYCRCHMLAQPNIHVFTCPPTAGTKSSPSGSAWPKSVSNCRVNTLLVEDGTRSIHPRTRLSLRDCILTGSGTALCLFSGSRLISFSAKMEVVSGSL